jgi:hypothetical protein
MLSIHYAKLHNEDSRRPSYEIQGCLHSRRNRHEPGSPRFYGRVFGKSQETETDSASRKEKEITRMARARRWLRPNDKPLQRIAKGAQYMAIRILSKQPTFFTGEEFALCRRTLATICTPTHPLERIFEAAGKRSAEEIRPEEWW